MKIKQQELQQRMKQRWNWDWNQNQDLIWARDEKQQNEEQWDKEQQDEEQWDEHAVTLSFIQMNADLFAAFHI